MTPRKEIDGFKSGDHVRLGLQVHEIISVHDGDEPKAKLKLMAGRVPLKLLTRVMPPEEIAKFMTPTRVLREEKIKATAKKIVTAFWHDMNGDLDIPTWSSSGPYARLQKNIEKALENK